MVDGLPPFLVTGSGRCGTHYLCAVLNELGIETGHESVFGYDEASAGRWGGLRGDCSWPGAAYAHRLPHGTRVLHLVRDPLAIVRSRAGDNNLGASSTRRLVLRFVERHRPTIFESAVDDLGRAMLFVVEWNRMVERLRAAFPQLEHKRVRVEDLSVDPGRLARTAEFLVGSHLPVERCQSVQTRIESSIGSRGIRAQLGWDDVERHPNGAGLIALARDYGYST